MYILGIFRKKEDILGSYFLLNYFKVFGPLFIWYFMVWLQKWSKGKQKEKVNNMVLFDQASYDKLLSEVPKYKLITPSILSDRLRV